MDDYLTFENLPYSEYSSSSSPEVTGSVHEHSRLASREKRRPQKLALHTIKDTLSGTNRTAQANTANRAADLVLPSLRGDLAQEWGN